MGMSWTSEVKGEQPGWWEGSGFRGLGYEVDSMGWAGSQASFVESLRVCLDLLEGQNLTYSCNSNLPVHLFLL